MTRTVLAADIGGTYLRAGIVGEDGRILQRSERHTPERATSAEIAGAIASLLAETAARASATPLAACIATAGLVNAHEGKVILAPNIPGFRDIVLTAPVKERLGIETYIENDASAAALGEYRFGAGRGHRNLLHATLGTGIGGGLVIEGRLYRGARGMAGEIGHMIIDPSGPVCACGSRGCLEAMVSGVAFANRARIVIANKKSPLLAEIAAGRAPTGEDLFAAASQGDPVCTAEIQHGGHLLGLGIGSLLNVLNPEAVTLSGGLLAMGEMLLEPMRRALRSMAYGSSAGTLILQSELGGDAGLLGAAAVAFEFLESEEGARG